MHITPTLHQHYTNSAHGCKHVTHMPLSVIPWPVSSMTPVGDLIHPQIANLHHGINPSKSQKQQTNCSMAEIDPNNIPKPLNHWIWCWFIFHKIPAQHIRWPKRTVQPSHARRTKVHTLALVHLSGGRKEVRRSPSLWRRFTVINQPNCGYFMGIFMEVIFVDMVDAFQCHQTRLPGKSPINGHSNTNLREHIELNGGCFNKPCLKRRRLCCGCLGLARCPAWTCARKVTIYLISRGYYAILGRNDLPSGYLT